MHAGILLKAVRNFVIINDILFLSSSVEFEKVQYELGALEQITKLIQTRGVDEYYRKALVEAGFGWLWGFLEYGIILQQCTRSIF
jgi:hypothetical protein